MSSDPRVLQRRLRALANADPVRILADNRIGIEKEGLRVSPAGRIAATPHPAPLGSALTHPYITTDFSEALIELITPALQDPYEVIAFLADLHVEVYRHLGDELLWATSMPCVLEGARSIPLAVYGSSNAATHEDRLPPGSGQSLRAHHAGDRRGPLQLLLRRVLLVPYQDLEGDRRRPGALPLRVPTWP